MYFHISIHIYTLDQGRWLDLKQGAKSLWNSVPKQCADLEQNLNLKEVRHLETWKKCSLALPQSRDAPNAWALGPAAFFREVREKRTIDLGPIWSHKWWEIAPYTHLQKGLGPMDGEKWSQQLSKCRYLSTDLSTRSIDHGRYRRSIRIHLLENTVDIDGRCRFTYGELRSIIDGRLKIEIILWSISSTTPVKNCTARSLMWTWTPVFGHIKHVKKHPKIPANAISDALLNVMFSKFRTDAARKSAAGHFHCEWYEEKHHR